MTQSLSGELADGQRKLVALALAGASSDSKNPLITQLSNGPIGSFHEKVSFSCRYIVCNHYNILIFIDTHLLQ